MIQFIFTNEPQSVLTVKVSAVTKSLKLCNVSFSKKVKKINPHIYN